jgi:rSAM/selenodomain-associated transferase 2/rSAM/selenodomain-associated transferase 1
MLLKAMEDHRRQLFLFARFPTPGTVKTRLIPTLGAEGAARLARRLTEHAVAMARAARLEDGIAVTMCCTGGRRQDFRAWLGNNLHFLDQASGNIGERMRRAFEEAFANGASNALAVGTDLPGISTDILRHAANALNDHDVVLGPAADGGYYLIGMKRYRPELFAGINWSTEHVAQQTRAVIERLSLTLAELPQLSDVDRPEDLEPLRDNPGFIDVFTGKPRLSVIILTLNEAEVLSATLKHVRQADGVEIIVADGGSQDATRSIAADSGAMVVTETSGRGAQLNEAANRASGRFLLFLHADTLLPDGYAAVVRRTFYDPCTVAGAFRFRTDSPGIGMRIVEWGTNIRSSIFKWPYGDQGLFIEKRVFYELDGFVDLPIMEDFDLVRRLRCRGRVVTVPDAVVTSARRWQWLGILRTIVRNQVMILGYFAGVKPERLARFYRAGFTEKV